MVCVTGVPVKLGTDAPCVTVYTPGAAKVTVGFCSAETDGVAPGKDQDQVLGELLDWSVKFTNCPLQSAGEFVKETTGACELAAKYKTLKRERRKVFLQIKE